VWDSLLWIWGTECVLRVGKLGVDMREGVCAVCGRVWCGYERVSVCCACESLVLEWGKRMCAVCGRVWCGFEGVSLWCVW